MEQAINQARHGKTNPVYLKTKDTEITGKDMRLLRDYEWLNDEVMNCTLKLIQGRNADKGLQKVFCSTTFFLPKLLLRGHAESKRLLQDTDVFEYNLWIIPYNQNKHWSLFMVDNIKRRLTYYDSYLVSYKENKEKKKAARPLPDTKCFKALRDFLENEHLRLKGTKLLHQYTTFTDLNAPQQDNGFDCGVFACQFAECLSRGAPFDFSHRDIPYFRKKMAWEILTNKFLE